MGGPSLVLKGDARPLKTMAQRVRQAFGKADTRELLNNLGGEVVATVMGRFREGTDPDGNKWPVSLRARLEGGATLEQSGNLRDSYTYAIAIAGDQVEIGSNLAYAAIHHFGGEIRAKNADKLHFTIGGRHVAKKSVTIPARPALGLNDEDEANLLESAQDWMTSIVRGIA